MEIYSLLNLKFIIFFLSNFYKNWSSYFVTSFPFIII
jgi:hypothetical protein